jgi:BirA family biotin operon repressor/biotin-[acetyl-CoA-carboxylase] ligase
VSPAVADPAGPVDADALRSTLGERWPRIAVVDETESTNADLLADEAAPDRSALVAEHQLSGRGRLNRAWISRPGAGLTFSVLLRPQAPIVTWGWLPLLAGVALHAAVVDSTGVGAGLKWPNDLLVGPQQLKAAGILAQTSGEAVVIGIGLNVSATELPVESATSLALCGATRLDRTELLAAILTQLDGRVLEWTAAAGDAEASGLASAYRAVCTTLGQVVNVTSTQGPVISGSAVDIDSTGRLIVRTALGEQAVGAGDVEHVRPA